MPRKPASFLRLLPVLFLYALVGCSGESEEIRYRATAGAVVDGKLYEGTVVRKTRFTSTPNSLTGIQASVKDHGDAVRVDVGQDRSAVYLLLNDRGGGGEFPLIVWECFKIDTENNPDWIAELRDVPVGKKCTLTPAGMGHIMPLVVAFRDESSPKSIFEVTRNSYREAFGVEAWFSHLTLERVDDAVPPGIAIDQHLPWLNQIPFEGTNIRSLDPHIPIGLLARDATLAQSVMDYFFTER